MEHNTRTTPAKRRLRHTRLFLGALLPVLLFADPQLPLDGILSEVVRALGILLVIGGVFIRWLCTLFIGGKKNTMVISAGPYSVVRNPLYVGTFLGITGVGLQSGTVSIPLLLVVLFGLIYYFIVQGEERYLAATFPADYPAYAERTPRWIPNLALWTAPEVVDVHQRLVLIALRDSVGLLASIPILALLNALKAHHLLPFVFPLY